MKKRSNTKAEASNPAASAPTVPAAANEVGLQEIVRHARIIVCCGPGGVGKTTTAAALAIAATRYGRRTAVVTIDPAKRLADAFGLQALTNRPARVRNLGVDEARGVAGAGGVGNSEPNLGELWALMLDTKATFDDLVRRHAPSVAQGERILDNPFYRNISTALSGTQEYMAMEKLYELATGPVTEDGETVAGFDCIVVDTPPSRNALDFLTAPERLTRFLDNRVFRALTGPARGGFRIVGFATQAVLRSIGSVVGGEVIADAVAFFQAFEGMEAGFRERAQHVLAQLRDPSTGFVVITSPRSEAVEEAVFLTNRLVEDGLPLAGVIANRVQPSFGELPTITSLPSSSRSSEALRRAHRSAELATAQRTRLQVLIDVAPQVPHVYVPAFASDVHDLTALRVVADSLLGTTVHTTQP